MLEIDETKICNYSLLSPMGTNITICLADLELEASPLLMGKYQIKENLKW